MTKTKETKRRRRRGVRLEHLPPGEYRAVLAAITYGADGRLTNVKLKHVERLDAKTS